jgi:hypothetical protein
MTGVLNAMVGLGSAATISVTIGNSASQYGFNSVLAIGAASPSTFKGNSLRAIVSDTAYDLTLEILGASIPQAIFRSLVVESTAGTIRTFDASAATFSQLSAPDRSTWTWGTGSSKVWTSTSPSPRSVLIKY